MSKNWAKGAINSVVINVPQEDVQLGQETAKTVCKNCQKEVLTRVEDTVSRDGIVWAVICCLCGSCLVSWLACCLPGFRKYTHSCPSCNAIIGEVEPSHTTCHMIIIFLSIIFVALLIVFYFWFRLNIDRIVD